MIRSKDDEWREGGRKRRMDCYRRDWLKSDLSVDFISFGISKQSEIVEETEKLGR